MDSSPPRSISSDTSSLHSFTLNFTTSTQSSSISLRSIRFSDLDLPSSPSNLDEEEEEGGGDSDEMNGIEIEEEEVEEEIEDDSGSISNQTVVNPSSSVDRFEIGEIGEKGVSVEGVEGKAEGFGVEETGVGEKGVKGVGMAVEDVGVEEGNEVLNSWTLKGPILFLVLSLNLAPNWIADSLPPLKATLVDKLGIENAQYGDIASASSLINTFFPLISGVWVDWYGAEFVGVGASVALLLGALLTALGASYRSYPLVLVGEVVGGFGSVTLYTAQTKIYTHWFLRSPSTSSISSYSSSSSSESGTESKSTRSREKRGGGGRGVRGSGGNRIGIGFIYGLDLAVGRGVNVIAQSTAYPIVLETNYFSWALWVPVFISVLTLIFNVIYIWFERTIVPNNFRSVGGRELSLLRRSNAGCLGGGGGENDEKNIVGVSVKEVVEEKRMAEGNAGRAGKGLNWKLIFNSTLLIPGGFWLITLTQMLQIGTTQTYLNLTANMIQVTRGESNLLAGYYGAIQQVSSIILTPLIGFLFDKFGKRFYYVTLGSILWILIFLTMGFFKEVDVLVPVILTSLTLSINLLPFLATVPILVPDEKLIGTAFGIWKCFENTGHVIISVLAGVIQDQSPVGVDSYKNVFILLLSFKSLDLFLSLGIYQWIDKKYLGCVFSMSEEERLNSLSLFKEKMQVEENGKELVIRRRRTLSEPSKIWTNLSLGIGGLMVCLAWGLYLGFAK